MRSGLFSVFFTCLFVGTTAVAFDEPPPDDATFDAMTYYYIEKDTGEIPKFLQQIEDLKLLDKYESSVHPITGFLTVAFEENPKRVTKLAKCAAFSGKAKRMVERALWLSGNGNKIESIFGETPAFAKKKAIGLRERPFKKPGDLDMMWGAFLASGDASYAKRLIDLLDENFELDVEDDATASAMRKAAEWSLESNMHQHELIYRMIVEEEAKRTGTVKKKLRKLLDLVASPGLPHKDGDFSADLLLMDAAGLAELKIPTDEPIKLDSKSKAERGDVLGIKVVFTGIALDDELDSDVSYDLKILDPDGQIYSKSDVKNLVGLKTRVPTRFRFFDNAQVVSLRFEPKDKLGKYQVLVTVRDNIGGKSVKLKRTIELTD